MSKVALSGNASGTGTFTIASPNSNTDRTISLPDQTGTILTTATAGVPVNGPAFSAYMSTNQTLSSNTETKLQFQTEEFDTNSNYDNATNYRFTPTVAGYYQVNGGFTANAAYTAGVMTIYKNGASYKVGGGNSGSASGISNTWAVNALVYLNGSTDYIELYGIVLSGQAIRSGINTTYFQAFLARSAT